MSLAPGRPPTPLGLLGGYRAGVGIGHGIVGLGLALLNTLEVTSQGRLTRPDLENGAGKKILTLVFNSDHGSYHCGQSTNQHQYWYFNPSSD